MAEKMQLTGVKFFTEKQVDGITCGSGVMGELPGAMAADDFIMMLKREFDVECVQCNQLLRPPYPHGSHLRRSRVVPPAGSDSRRCRRLVTGEMHYHDYSLMSRKYRLP